jgi:hypothetical protein
MAPPAQRRSWMQRHWLLVVVLSTVLMLAVGAGAGALMVYGLGKSAKDSEPYREALARARAHPEVAARLGEPLQDQAWVLGAVEDRDGGEVRLVSFLRGPRGQGEMVIEGARRGERWDYQVMQVTVERQRIDLLGPDDRDSGEATEDLMPVYESP